jgi:hypothetical protein
MHHCRHHGGGEGSLKRDPVSIEDAYRRFCESVLTSTFNIADCYTENEYTSNFRQIAGTI